MTRGGVKEYLEAVQGRYLKGNRKEKGRILDEVTKVTGYHRKAAIRLLGQRGKRKPVGRRGRTKQYGVEVVAALKEAWEASDRMCSRRLQPFLPELVEALERHGETNLTGELREQLCRISVAIYSLPQAKGSEDGVILFASLEAGRFSLKPLNLIFHEGNDSKGILGQFNTFLVYLLLSNFGLAGHRVFLLEIEPENGAGILHKIIRPLTRKRS
ncbi:MAG: hypothetical protein IIB31_07790 [Chloroflexi bacterium]|nr:hypothetical protein [Chloroflexota bacterium]